MEHPGSLSMRSFATPGVCTDPHRVRRAPPAPHRRLLAATQLKVPAAALRPRALGSALRPSAHCRCWRRASCCCFRSGLSPLCRTSHDASTRSLSQSCRFAGTSPPRHHIHDPTYRDLEGLEHVHCGSGMPSRRGIVLVSCKPHGWSGLDGWLATAKQERARATA